ncbi:N-acetyltransferase family protein [Pseudoduganella sp. RAF19]
MESGEIKVIGSEDFDIWLPLWKAYQRCCDVDLPDSVTRKTWARLLDPVEPVHAVLAIAGNRALGLAHSIYHRSAWTADNHCYLQDLFVAHDARGVGVGRALIEHIYADARRCGAAQVHWPTRLTLYWPADTSDSYPDGQCSIPVGSLYPAGRPRGGGL